MKPSDHTLEALWEWHCREGDAELERLKGVSEVEQNRAAIRATLRYCRDAEAVKRHHGEHETADMIAETIRVLERILMTDD